MISVTRRLLALLTKKEIRHFYGTLLTSVFAGMIQVASVGSVIPFVALLLNPELIQTNQNFAFIYEKLGFESNRIFFLFAGLMVLVALVLGNAFNAFTLWYVTKFSWDFQVRLSASLFYSIITKPYIHFVNRNSSDIAKNILVESTQIAQGVLLALTKIISNSLITFCICVFLFWLNPLITFIVVLVFIIAYAFIYVVVRRPVKRIGEHRFTVNTKRFNSVTQAFGSLKEVKLLNKETEFVDIYSNSAYTFARTITLQAVLSLVPKYIIEALAFGLLVVIILYMLYFDVSMQMFLPIASGFALAGYRILPALQGIYVAINTIRFNAPVLDAVEQDLLLDEYHDSRYIVSMPFKNNLKLVDASYTYPGSDKASVKNLNLEIPRQSFVAFVGKTGAGKTTIVDILLGLIVPDRGRYYVDGVEINKTNIKSWQANLGYVPQEIFLLDDTIAANIAFGVPSTDIDMLAVEEAAKIANIHEFISISLPDGYCTRVGERGVRLSGGERQRIGIARALYQDPDILVLDEATSALDSATENIVHNAIARTAEIKTVIVIAHRLSTVRDCDTIFFLKNGQIEDQGSFDELCDRNTEFRSLTEGSELGGTRRSESQL